jgi:hypothetical protein
MGLDDMARIQWPAARELRDTMLCHIERKKRAATAGRLAAQSELSYQTAAGSLGRGVETDSTNKLGRTPNVPSPNI